MSGERNWIVTGAFAAVALGSLFRVSRLYKTDGAVDCNAVGTIRLGTRKSDLAMVQTHYVKALLSKAFPNVKIEIQEGVQALGDQVLNESLKNLAAKTPGLFTKELEAGLLDGQYDAVVHSLKDMPTTLPDGLVLAGVSEREDPRDALVVHETFRGLGGLDSLPEGSVIGTSSIRREAMLKRDYPHLTIKLIRGNVNTRLAKLDSGEFDAIVLAVAGLKRLGKEFEERIEQVLQPPQFMYGVSQGALGLQCRKDDPKMIQMLKAIQHAPTAARCLAERALLRKLQGGCQVPLGVWSKIEEDRMTLSCTILAEDGSESVTMSVSGTVETPETVGEALARELMEHPVAAKLLERFRSGDDPRPLTYGNAEAPNTIARPPPMNASPGVTKASS